MAHKPVSTFTAGRPMTLNGVTFAIGATVSWAQIKACKGVRVSALVARRYLIPNLDSSSRKLSVKTPRPADVPASVMRNLT